MLHGAMDDTPGTSTLGLLKLKRYAGKGCPSMRTTWWTPSTSALRACVREQQTSACWPTVTAAAAAAAIVSKTSLLPAALQDRDCASSLQQRLQYMDRSQVNLDCAKELVKNYQEHKQQQLQVQTESDVAASLLGKTSSKVTLPGW